MGADLFQDRASCGLLGTRWQIFGFCAMRGNSWPTGQQEVLTKHCTVDLVISLITDLRVMHEEWDLVTCYYIRYNCTFQSYHRDQKVQKSHIMAKTVNKSCLHCSIVFLGSPPHRNTIPFTQYAILAHHKLKKKTLHDILAWFFRFSSSNFELNPSNDTYASVSVIRTF
jgi:hypothetical protein